MNGRVARCSESGVAERQMFIYIPAPVLRAPYPSSARYDLYRYV